MWGKLTFRAEEESHEPSPGACARTYRRGSLVPAARAGRQCEVPFETDIAMAAPADEDVSMSAISRCLLPDKPAMCACSVRPREGAKCEFPRERDIAVAALADEH
eukprot:700802-Heterocapsa_arctica.AAC.1